MTGNDVDGDFDNATDGMVFLYNDLFGIFETYWSDDIRYTALYQSPDKNFMAVGFMTDDCGYTLWDDLALQKFAVWYRQ